MSFEEILQIIKDLPIDELRKRISEGTLGDITCEDKYGNTLLSHIKDYPKYELLVNLGCEIVHLNHVRIFNASASMIKKYLRKSGKKITIDCSIVNTYKMNFLHVYSKLMELLLEQNLLNFDPNAREHNGLTILHYVCKNKNVSQDIIDKLIRMSVDPTISSVPHDVTKDTGRLAGDYLPKIPQNKDSYTMMSFDMTLSLVKELCTKTLQQMIDAKHIDVNIKGAMGSSLLCKELSHEKYELLIKNGCSIVVICNDGKFANIRNCLDVIGSNVTLSIDCSIKSIHGTNFIHAYSKLPVFNKILSQKLINFDINEKIFGCTILHKICRDYNVTEDTINKLIALGADPTILSDEGKTAVEYFAKNSNIIISSKTTSAKNALTVATLEAQLAKKDILISTLTDDISTLTNSISTLTNSISELTEKLDSVNAIIQV